MKVKRKKKKNNSALVLLVLGPLNTTTYCIYFYGTVIVSFSVVFLQTFSTFQAAVESCVKLNTSLCDVHEVNEACNLRARCRQTECLRFKITRPCCSGEMRES